MDKTSVFECLELEKITGFEWDEGNILKNELKHGLFYKEIEEVFFNEPLLLTEDRKHSQKECRCFALGQTDAGKRVLVVFTLRDQKIRVISARPMSKKERRIYEQA
ncbi:BrnT family toxin [Nitratifractor sp.]